MSTIDDIVLQMKILTNKITVFRSTITTDMTNESQARINYDEYLRDLVQGLQDQISSIDITNNTAGILDVINAVSTAIDSHQLVLSPQATIRAIKRIAPLNGGAVNVTEDANNIFIHGEGNGISRQRIVRYTESATLKLSDANCIIECDSTDLIVLTVPAYDDIPFKSAVLFDIVQINTGGVQVVGASGVTIEASGDGLDGIDTSGLLYLSTEPNRFIFSIAGGTGVPDGGTTGQALLKQSGIDGDATWQTLTKGMVGLSNVANLAPVDMPVSTAQAAADTATLNSAKTYADGADTSTLNSAKAYTDAMTTGLLQFIGNWSASGGLYPTTGGSGAAGAVVIGDVWRVSVAGTVGGVNYRIGDSFYATSNTPAQDPTKWASILLELGYNPEDVANKVTAFSSPTDGQYPSALLVKTQLDLKLNDVTNGTGTGATQVTTPVAGTRAIARIGAASADVVVTQGAAGAPNTIGLNGTTLKYWEEVSTAIDASTQRLAWRPKDPNGTFVRANTVQVIATPRGLTLRDPQESGSTFPTAFTTGLDIQLKGTLGTAATYSRGGYCFGMANTAYLNSTALGISNIAYKDNVAIGRGNTAGAASYDSTGAVAIGIGNTANANYIGACGVAIGRDNYAEQWTAIGTSCSAVGYAVVLGQSNSGYGNAGANFLVGASLTNTGVGSSSNTLVGLEITATNTAQGIYIGRGIAATAASRSIVINAHPSFTTTDQGITGFQQVGRIANIPLSGVISNISDWTNTAWRDVPNSSIADNGTGWVSCKMRLRMDWKDDSSNGSHTVPVSPTRVGVYHLETWGNPGSTVLGVNALEGGDANFLTYFNFRFVTAGSGYKLQYAIIADPTEGTSAANRQQIVFTGSMTAEWIS